MQLGGLELEGRRSGRGRVSITKAAGYALENWNIEIIAEKWRAPDGNRAGNEIRGASRGHGRRVDAGKDEGKDEDEDENEYGYEHEDEDEVEASRMTRALPSYRGT